MLKTIVSHRIRHVVVACIPNPESVEKAQRAGVGGKVMIEVGGNMDHLYNNPVALEARVTHVSSRRYRPQVTTVC